METTFSPAQLWTGVELKRQHAEFFLNRMESSLQPPEQTQRNVALLSSDVIIDTQWQRSFYPYFDAFLAMTRSVPEIVNYCFGKDTRHKEAIAWFRTLDQDEQQRRRTFSADFEVCGYKKFRESALARARNIIFHRAGYTPAVQVKTIGFLGVTYVGDPITAIPLTETRPTERGRSTSMDVEAAPCSSAAVV